MTDDPVESTFLVVEADDCAAVLRSVHDGRIHPLDAAPADLDPGEVIEGRVEPGAMGVTWELTAINARRSISVEESDESPTAHERTIAPDDLGELARADRAGTGELHVLRVAEDDTEKAVVDVLSDAEQLRERAARLGVDRVVVRSEPGLVSIRYLP